MNKGDIVWYDDDRGKVVETKDVTRPYSNTVGRDIRVRFDNGHEEWCWESDLIVETPGVN